MDDVAVLVAEDLDLDMARIDDELLDEHPVVAERGFRLRPRTRETFGDLGLGMRNPHALAAAARRGLDHHGITDLVGDSYRVLLVGDDAEMAWNGGHLGLRGCLLALDFVAHGGDRPGLGPMKTMPALASAWERPRARTESRSPDAPASAPGRLQASMILSMTR